MSLDGLLWGNLTKSGHIRVYPSCEVYEVSQHEANMPGCREKKHRESGVEKYSYHSTDVYLR